MIKFHFAMLHNDDDGSFEMNQAIKQSINHDTVLVL